MRYNSVFQYCDKSAIYCLASLRTNIIHTVQLTHFNAFRRSYQPANISRKHFRTAGAGG